LKRMLKYRLLLLVLIGLLGHLVLLLQRECLRNVGGTGRQDQEQDMQLRQIQKCHHQRVRLRTQMYCDHNASTCIRILVACDRNGDRVFGSTALGLHMNGGGGNEPVLELGCPRRLPRIILLLSPTWLLLPLLLR